MPTSLRVVIIKPSKYMVDGSVERFQRGFMPNSTVPHMRSMVPAEIDQHAVETRAIDEYVYTDLEYLNLLEPARNSTMLVVLVGVQSHQFHRALDIAALAHRNGRKQGHTILRTGRLASAGSGVSPIFSRS